jgi:hypothetical protein
MNIPRQDLWVNVKPLRGEPFGRLRATSNVEWDGRERSPATLLRAVSLPALSSQVVGDSLHGKR